MLDIYKTRENAFELASEELNMDGRDHSTYSPIYISATENVKDLMKLYKNYETVLSVGSAGAQGFEAALNGARKVDLFDINELQRLYFEYMRTAIMVLDYDTFTKHFTIRSNNFKFQRHEFKDLLSEELYDKVVKYLPQDVETVYTPLYDYFNSVDLVLSNLYRSDYSLLLSYLKKNISFYNEDEYYKLQRILRDETCKIDYKTISLTEIPKEYKDKYDLIILSNILQYYKEIANLNTIPLVERFIKKLSKSLTEDGAIQVNYLYEVPALAFKDIYDPLFDRSFINPIIQFIIKQEAKTGVNLPLYESSDNYSYSCIRGVEKSILENPENVILTYRNNKSNKIFTP